MLFCFNCAKYYFNTIYVRSILYGSTCVFCMHPIIIVHDRGVEHIGVFINMAYTHYPGDYSLTSLYLVRLVVYKLHPNYYPSPHVSLTGFGLALPPSSSDYTLREHPYEIPFRYLPLPWKNILYENITNTQGESGVYVHPKLCNYTIV